MDTDLVTTVGLSVGICVLVSSVACSLSDIAALFPLVIALMRGGFCWPRGLASRPAAGSRGALTISALLRAYSAPRRRLPLKKQCL